MKPTVYYLYDALCGWCYGFSPVMRQFFEQHKTEADFRVVSGGMITAERIGPIFESAPYIRTAYKDVEQATGVQFGEPFLKGILAEGTTVMTSVPAATAMAVFQEKFPEKAVPFSADLLRMVYRDGEAPEHMSGYVERAAEYGFPRDEFRYKLNSKEYHDRAFADFDLAGQFGVSGFPSLIVHAGTEYFLLSRGYTSFSTLERVWNKIMADVKGGSV